MWQMPSVRPGMSQGLLDVVVEALQASGATEEMVAAAVGAYGAWERAPRL
jgi:hypothetical protein